MSVEESNNASEETLHAPLHPNFEKTDQPPLVKRYDAEVGSGLQPIRDPLVSHGSETSSARTIRDDTGGLDKEKGGNGGSNQYSGGDVSGDGPPRRPGLLERTTSGHARGQKREDGKVELREKDVYDELGFRYSPTKKWTILSVC